MYILAVNKIYKLSSSGRIGLCMQYGEGVQFSRSFRRERGMGWEPSGSLTVGGGGSEDTHT